MTNPSSSRIHHSSLIILVPAILAAGAFFAWWVVARADREMRADLLQQTRLVVRTVCIEDVQALSGTEADLATPDYRRLKEQVAAIRSTSPGYSFVYLMGRKADGAVFFFLNSEPARSEDYSPPGHVYEEVPASFLRVFDTKAEAVEGRVTVRLGSEISALVPMTDPQTGAVVAVLGIEVDARTWKWDVAARSALPVGLLLVLLIGAAAAVVSARPVCRDGTGRRVDASPKPVLRYLFPPLVVMVILLMAGAAMLLYQQYRQRVAADIAHHVSGVEQTLRLSLDLQTLGLAAAAQPIAADVNVQEALRESDADRLLTVWRPVYETFHREDHVTHFYFFDKNRVCLLRVHRPEERGDRIERFTALEAERTGKTASGIELGRLGSLTLRVVQPIFSEGALVGYVELGKEIEELLQGCVRGGDGLAVLIRKEHLNRQTWEESMRLLGREADWDHLSHSALMYVSQGRLPDAFASWADEVVGGHAHRETDREIAFDGKDWFASTTPLEDASGKEVGALLIMHDITADKAAFARLLVLGGTAGAVLLALLMGFIFALLRRTDAGIRAQQAELRESEERLSATLRSIGDGVIACDAGGNVVNLNAVAETLTGWSAGEARGRPIAEVLRIIHAETRQVAEIPVGRALREDRIMRLTNHTAIIARDGVERRIADTCAPIHDAAGVVIGAVLVFRDVTEEYRRLDRLRESEERFRILNDNLSVGVAMVGTDMGILAINPRIRQWFPGADPTGHPPCYDAFNVPPRNEICTGCPVAETLRDGQIHVAEREASTCDGKRYFRMTATAITDRDGKVTSAVEMIDDITEYRRAEEALRESERRHRALFDQANEGLLVMSLDGQLSEHNRAFAEMHGYREGELKSMDIRDLDVLKERALEGRADILRRVQAGEVVRFEVEHYHKDGHIFPLGVTTSTVNIGGQSFYLAYHQDITERKRAEEELLETNRHLEAATARANEMAVHAEMAAIAKSEFLANMSHEIRTPMNGVIGMAGLLLDTELDDEQRRYADILRASGESLLGLINDILDFSKIESKKLDLEMLDFDLSSLLDDFAATIAVSAHDKGIELLCAADPEVPVLLRGDPGRLRQILGNLAGNAVKFTHAGEVTVRVSLVEENENDVLLRFSVRDTGIGIPEDKIGLLFDKFSQVDASTTRRYGGTGLGLAISKQLAELMGGKVDMSSEEGKGSEFWFTARLGKQAEGTQAESRPPADLRDVRVLIVDDNDTGREILTTLLASWGMRPSDVHDGPGALQALYRALDENDPFRIAVIDMQMPGMDGEALGRTIKADERLADTRMVMLTSMGTRGDARRFEEMGFAAYATKPIRRQELKAVLSLAMTERDGAEPTPRPIVTRHTARETLNPFAGRKARILLAEDNIFNQQVALGILKKLGLRADAVANGAEALKAIETIPYDLVLMDLQMPEMDGLEATRRVRNPKSAIPNRQIPIIAMTAHAMQGDRERCLEAGMNDYVSKPVTPRALAEALDKWLPKENAECRKKKEEIDEGGSPSSLITHHSSRIFDRAGMMARLMDDEKLARTVVEGFLDDIPRQIAAVKGYLETGDAPGVERQAHSIRGASANVGGERLREVAFELEKAAKAGDLSAAGGHMAELEAQFGRLKEAMTKEL